MPEKKKKPLFRPRDEQDTGLLQLFDALEKRITMYLDPNDPDLRHVLVERIAAVSPQVEELIIKSGIKTVKRLTVGSAEIVLKNGKRVSFEGKGYFHHEGYPPSAQVTVRTGGGRQLALFDSWETTDDLTAYVEKYKGEKA